ncbi:NAD(P)H-hydrate dehydratase [Sulfurimonas autotrophica]|uniref:Bifunctional NAD(P)H-hydrate repair enzyme n=1 Tax=Sulfurimonas autotrophica (strain ATCC BAA-671 / DSM 16294 / JCM 11897 / OK10) TaxID=563040 RepID=E0UTL4_SULAO|nr:NAD(P)H-hydrate dehydratase [Sulfurimonas autotrophica]ADN08245.1 carbohydrate kinase, YjeF related protein [Sulfurimonas autotrophica DSM 16294]
MQKLFEEVGSLDARCYEEFFLSEDILMEHAAQGMASYIKNNFSNNEKIIIAVGSGNNGADGIALARLLHGDYNVSLFFVKEPKSHMALLQEKRAQAINVPIIPKLQECNIFVDAIVGTGFDGEFNEKITTVLEKMNTLEAFKIACDVPSGLKKSGECAQTTFHADTTLTMGALKKSLFLDEAKDYIGKIEVLDLGISRKLYETQTNWHLLDLDDLQLPLRAQQNSYKGSFGHLAVLCGEKPGACVMSALAGLRFGAGLVTLVGYENHQMLNIPHSLMYAHALPSNTTAIACGMGLGVEFSDNELRNFLDNDLALIIDADLFSMEVILELLERKNIVLTPHPKEFVSLLKITELADISVEELQKKRFFYVELFCKAYPNTTLLLKGANVIIGSDNDFFINPHGSSKLAKGGSGDVLSGLIGSLLAQGKSPLDATIHGSLAHTKLAQNYTGADFSLTPEDLIQGIGNL